MQKMRLCEKILKRNDLKKDRKRAQMTSFALSFFNVSLRKTRKLQNFYNFSLEIWKKMVIMKSGKNFHEM